MAFPSTDQPQPTDPASTLAVFSGAHDFSVAQQNVINVQINHNVESSSLLKPLVNASHIRNRKIHPPDSNCLPGTRRLLIDRILAFAGGTTTHDAHRILWLHGSAGSGKSAVAQAVAESVAKTKRLAASWFFFRGAGDRSGMKHFPITLATQMRNAIPGAGVYLDAAVAAEPGLETADISLPIRLEQLVYVPLQVARAGSTDNYLIVIDGFDECEDEEGAIQFLDHLLEFLGDNPSTPIRFLVTSRIEEHIQTRLRLSPVVLSLDVDTWKSRTDMYSFLKAFFAHASRHSRIISSAQPWPSEYDLQALVDHVQDSYILASTLCKYVTSSSLKDGLTPMKRLPLALQMSTGLDGLYKQVLQRSQHNPHFSDVVSTIALLASPRPVTTIAQLIGIGNDDVLNVLLPLQAIVHLPGSDDEPVTTFHTTLRDFLTAEARSGQYFVSPHYHQRLALGCLKVLDRSYAPTTCHYASNSHSRHWKQCIQRLHPTDLKPFLSRIFATYDPHWGSTQGSIEKDFDSRSTFERTLILLLVLAGGDFDPICGLVVGPVSHRDKCFTFAITRLWKTHKRNLLEALLPLLQEVRPDLLDASTRWEFLRANIHRSFGIFTVRSARVDHGMIFRVVFPRWPKWLTLALSDPGSTWEDLQRQGSISASFEAEHPTEPAETHITWTMESLSSFRSDVADLIELLEGKFSGAFSRLNGQEEGDERNPLTIHCAYSETDVTRSRSHTCKISVLQLCYVYGQIAHFLDAKDSTPSQRWTFRFECSRKAARLSARISDTEPDGPIKDRQFVTLSHECWYTPLGSNA